MIGKTLGHYHITEKLGEGGMGVVYKARDTHLDRFVAIKILPPDKVADPDRRRRFVQEAKTASALDHPNIVTIFDIEQEAGADYIVMEYLPGRTLKELIAAGGMDWKAALKHATAIADALAAAHRAGIIHRDLKPGNIMVTDQGLVKVLDFGLAKLTESAPSGGDEPTRTMKATTGAGAVLGTVAYMSPEQAEGRKLDARSDVFSFGAVLYELLTGRQAFHGDSQVSTISAILRDAPQPVRTVHPKIPAAVERILNRCLEKDRERRYQSAGDAHRDLAACQQRLAADEVGIRSLVRRPRYVIPAAALCLALAGAGAWVSLRNSRAAWAVNTALPEIARLADQGDYAGAFSLARRAGRYVPGNTRLEELSRSISVPVSIETNVAGAEVAYKEYGAVDGAWQPLGRAPLKAIAVPRGLKRWRISREGHRTVEAARSPDVDGPTLTFTLDKPDAVPADMVRVPRAAGFPFLFLTGLDHLPAPALDDFLIDTYEVTNRQFAAFVAAGGYRKREYWKHPFTDGGRVLSWEEAMAEFRDSTGQPGPATWELGSYPAGQEDLPVAGVSWYEAEAYAEFVGKSLPSIYHWNRAAWTNAGFRDISPVIRLSNFGGAGPSRGGRNPGLNPYGTYDLAGNVKEWCWNAAGPEDSRRYILGGAWNEPVYMFNDPDAQPPMKRLPTYGFRCVKYVGNAPPALLEPAVAARRNYDAEKPAGDEVFRIYRSFYSYDKTRVEPVVESVDDSAEYWRIEKVSLAAAYGDERLTIYVYLPRGVEPPYQTVVFFPGSGALRSRSFQASAQTATFDFVVRSGRAVVYPVYKSTYERGDGLLADRPNLSSTYRDHVIEWRKDFARSLDYLETRKDIDAAKLGYYGFSWGAVMGPILLAQDARVKAAVLACGGFWQQKGSPEVEQINFAPRLVIPVLMLNGKYDFVFPVDTSQAPMFRLFQTPDKDKRHMLFEAGHSVPRNDLVTETLRWFDRYLGPVRK
jgi:dienelactone hydrolase/predicted Ser/Thr protein kinase